MWAAAEGLHLDQSIINHLAIATGRSFRGTGRTQQRAETTWRQNIWTPKFDQRPTVPTRRAGQPSQIPGGSPHVLSTFSEHLTAALVTGVHSL